MTLRSFTLLIPLGLTLAGCSSDRLTEPRHVPAPLPAQTGQLWMQVTTSGIAPNTFVLVAEEIGTWTVRASEQLRLELRPGTYTIDLSIIDGTLRWQSCAVRGGSRQTVTLQAGGSRTVEFVVSCSQRPTQDSLPERR